METAHTSDRQIKMLSALERLDNIGQKDIETVRLKVKLNNLDLFDKLENSKKKMLALLNGLSPDELETLKEMEKEHGRLVGLHSINNHLSILSSLTQEP